MKDKGIAILAPTSMGIRMTPLDRQPVHTSDTFRLQSTSAESNVLQVSASLGKKCAVLTKFVKDSPIAAYIKAQLRARNIATFAQEVPQGGPWGYRHQFNIADSGYGLRGPNVWNDRAGEVGRTLSASDFDLESIFCEGVSIVHISGLIAALSEDTARFCLELAKVAKRHGTLVSFDLNYRASFWKGRKKELGDIFRSIADTADILIGNEEDFQLALGIKGPEAGGEGLSAKIDGFKNMIDRVKEAFPNARLFATTLREVISANTHLWGAIIRDGDGWYVELPREIPVLDRIGGGDGFVAGMLYGVLNGWNAEKCMQFGWATGVLAVTVFEDHATPVDEEQVWSIYKGNARVKR